jgi:hypothetical protein
MAIVESLDELIGKAKTAYEEGVLSASKSWDSFVTGGECLNRAKELCKYGNWEDRAEAAWAGSSRQRRRLMALASAMPHLRRIEFDFGAATWARVDEAIGRIATILPDPKRPDVAILSEVEETPALTILPPSQKPPDSPPIEQVKTTPVAESAPKPPQHAELPAAVREARRQMDAARHHASLIGMIVDELNEMPGRDFFEFAKVRQALSQIEQCCKVARPAITCPACGDTTSRAHCLMCKGRGWLSEMQKQQVSK